MAIWQVALDLVKNDEHIDFSSPVFISSLKKIEEVFPATRSWCKTITQYGKLDSTCLQFDIDENDAISIRIDLRNISIEQLQSLCEFAKENDLFIKYKGKLYEAVGYETFNSLEDFIETILGLQNEDPSNHCL